MKTNKEQYESPVCNVVEMEAQQIICVSGATHEGYEEEEYHW